MQFEINVSLNGKHLFATAERSLVTMRELEKCFEIFQKKFPESEGYELSLSYRKSEFYRVDSLESLRGAMEE